MDSLCNPSFFGELHSSCRTDTHGDCDRRQKQISIVLAALDSSVGTRAEIQMSNPNRRRQQKDSRHRRRRRRESSADPNSSDEDIPDLRILLEELREEEEEAKDSPSASSDKDLEINQDAILFVDPNNFFTRLGIPVDEDRLQRP